jgi:branched-chain amino acid transport system ATP-binding protein
MSTTNKTLVVKGLASSYGAIKALRGVDLKVVGGSVVSVVGRNGAGKSTLLNTLCGVVKADAGEVHFGDLDLSGQTAQKVTKSGVALVPEGRKIIAPLTVKENLHLSDAAKRKSDRDMEAWVFELFPRLKERTKQYAGSLSGGEQQMLAIGRALMTHPELLVLDEPSMGLAPLVVDKVYEYQHPSGGAGRQLGVVGCRLHVCRSAGRGGCQRHPRRSRKERLHRQRLLLVVAHSRETSYGSVFFWFALSCHRCGARRGVGRMSICTGCGCSRRGR